MAKMRGMAVEKAGGPLVAVERDIPEPGPDEIRIRIQACGVCHSDVATVQNLLPGIRYPRIPGHEVIGIVDALGSGVKGWSLGARAGVGWFGGACGYCSRCRRDAGFACENIHDVTGVSRDGGYATHMIALASSVAHVPDGRGTFVELTVEENLRLGAYVRNNRVEVARDFERVFGYFPRLRERFRQQAGTLSGGEQQMLAIARALLLRPKLLLLDEPSFGLAPLIVQEIFAIMHRIRAEEGVSILLVEQNASLALDIAEQAYLLETGRIVISGPAAEIRRDDSVRRSYLGY